MVTWRYYDDFCWGFFLFGLLSAGRAIQVLLRSFCQACYGIPPSVFPTRHWVWPLPFIVGVATFFMVRSELPMRVSFLLSRPALDAVADEALADPVNAHLLAGRQAGLYRIAGVEVIEKTVIIYVGKDKGEFGFARVPGPAPDLIFNSPSSANDPHHWPAFPEQHGSGEPYGKRIKGDWFVIYSWYWSVKVGWS
jgi:hypothetical protein